MVLQISLALAEYLCANLLKTKKSSCGMVLHGEFFIDILTHWLIITIFVPIEKIQSL